MAAFQFNCPQCGQSVEADESMRGMVATCPHCEKGIVIPKSTQNPALRRPSSVSNGPIDKSQGEKRDGVSDLNFLAIQRRMAEQESVARASAERIERIRTMNRKRELLAKIMYALIAIGVCTVGFLCWESWRDRRVAEKAMQQAVKEAQQRIDDERRAKEGEIRKAEAAQRRAEAEKQRQEREAQRKAEDEARERRRAEDAKHRAEEERIRQERIAAERAETQLRDDRRKKYDSVVGSLSHMTTEPWSHLAEERRLNVAGGESFCLVPEPNGNMILYRIDDTSVSSLSRDGDVESVERGTYEAVVTERGALRVADGKAYIVSPKMNDGELFPVPQSSVNPSELLFRGVCDIVHSVGANVDGISFGVTYVSADRKAEIPVKNVTFDQSVSRRDVLDAVTQHALKSFRPPKPAAKMKRRTVVFYDGLMVKNELNGVTYVPRTPPRRANKTYYSLCDEARRQEGLEEEARQSAEEAVREARERLSVRIEETLDAGRIRISVSKR